MPRKLFLPTAEYPYHVTGRCINKEWFSIPIDLVWNIFSDYLFFIHHAFDVRIHNFVLMNNHFHMVVHTPSANLDKAMNYFMRETSRVIGKTAGRINQVYGGPYHWSILQTQIYYLHAYKYVYRNPLEAGLAKKAMLYRYSTLNRLLGQERTIIPLLEDTLLIEDLGGTLDWIDKSYPSTEVYLDIKSALRKPEFKFRLAKNQHSHFLDNTLV